jgi:RNA polymerase sigma-70 factor (ECF subfamily)
VAFDLTAETFALVVAALGRFDPERGSARDWLFTIAANELRQALRRQRVEDRARRELLLEPIVMDDGALVLVEERASPGVVERALAELPAAEREAIEARVLEDAAYDEIAARLRCSASAVRQRVPRGLRRLKDTAEEGV